jgi:hypothetical protein
MSNAALVLTDCPAVRKTSAAAYAAIAKQSIVKIIRSVQSFLSVSSWRKSMGGEMPADRPLRTPSLRILDGVSALESLITRSIDRV